MKKKILIQYDSLWHYRKSLFEEFSNSTTLDIRIVCGRKSILPDLKTFSPNRNLKVYFIRNIRLIPSTNIVWQFGLCSYFIKNKPDIVILKGVDPHNVSNFMLFFLTKIFKKKVYFWGHGTLGNQGKLGKWLRIYFYKRANGTFVYSNDGLQNLKKNGVDVKRIHVVGNCINNEDYISKDFNFTSCKSNSYVFTGRLHPRKKLLFGINAIEDLSKFDSNINYKIIGSGSEKMKLDSIINKKKINNCVSLLGPKYGIELHQEMLNANAYLIPSAAGLSVYHAFAFGLPVITDNDIENHGPEFNDIIDNKNGFIYEKGSISSLIEKLKMVQSLTEKDRFEIRKYFLNNFTATSVVKRFFEVLSK